MSNKKTLAIITTLTIFLCTSTVVDGHENNQNRRGNYDTMYSHSTTIEKERPELDAKTKSLIANYRKNPTQENYDALRKQVEINYDKVLARKKDKLEELRHEARDKSKITEMEEIVAEMVNDREHRINQTMQRFTDARLRPGARESHDGFLPILGAAQNASIAYTTVTNAEYQKFIDSIGNSALHMQKQWSYPQNQQNYPATGVSYDDAVAYCRWRSNNEGVTYRLPTEEEWELAAGHMPKDADINCLSNGIVPVNEYADTISASGAINMWGNVWEWTSTPRQSKGKYYIAVKGGSYRSPKTNCRTEYRDEYRDKRNGYDDVGFRILREQ